MVSRLMEKRDYFGIILFILLIFNVIYSSYLLHLYLIGCESCQLCSEEVVGTPKSGAYLVGGVYYGAGNFSVWTKGMRAHQIEESQYHEVCHALVDRYYEHFCIESVYWGDGR